MKYILKNKDIDVLEFETSTEYDDYMKSNFTSLISVNILNKTLLPIFINDKHIKSSLEDWVKERKIPKHRKYVNQVLGTLKKEVQNDFMAYIDISLGLSLNDSFWIVPADKDYKWKDFNLYQNKFNEALALIAFSGQPSHKISDVTTSPEYTTNGALAKCWHRENGQIYLYKSGSEKYNLKEPYTEFYMAQIADIMGFDYVPYDLKEFHEKIVSSCPIFTNENEGYAPMYLYLHKENKKYTKTEQAQMAERLYGKEKFEDLMLFDGLICNCDRHLGNFGMIIDNNTNELLRPAPIFDNGLGFISRLQKNMLTNLKELFEQYDDEISHFELDFNQQIKRFVQPRHIPNLEKLVSFEFKKHSEFNLSDEWLEPIQEYIQDRARLAIQFAYEKQENSQKIKSSFRTDGSDSTSLSSIRNEMLGSSTQQADKQKPSVESDIDTNTGPKYPKR